MICFDGKQHVSSCMVNISEKYAKDSSYSMSDYASLVLKESGQRNRKLEDWPFLFSKSKSYEIKDDESLLIMKPRKIQNCTCGHVTENNEALNKKFSRVDEFQDSGANEGVKSRLQSTSTRTLRISKAPSAHFPSTDGEFERCEELMLPNFRGKCGNVTRRSGCCHRDCRTVNLTNFNSNDSSCHHLTNFDILKFPTSRHLVNESIKTSGNFQRRTHLFCDPHDRHNDNKYKCEKHSRTPNNNIPKGTGFMQNLILWIIIKIRYPFDGPQIEGEYASPKSRISNSRKWAIFLLFSFLLTTVDCKRALGNSLLLSPGQLCMRPRYLNSKQIEICRNSSDILKFVEEAVRLGSHHCQREFQLNRWNCSSSPKSYYSKLLQQDVRETAFITALTSAAVAYRLTVKCSKGDISNCGCTDEDNYISSYNLLKEEAKKRHHKVTERQLRQAAATFDWGGCRDLLEYGEYISTLFTENFGRKYNSFDLKGKIEKHNLKSGRKAVSNLMRRECKCHGLTGSCALTTCWDKLPPWSEVKSHLRTKFGSAVKVQLANDGKSLLPTRKQRLATREYPRVSKPEERESASSRSPRSFTTVRQRRHRKGSRARRKSSRRPRPTSVDDDDLVYSQESPNFCKKVRRHGTLGTTGRRCIPNITGAGSCTYLCCGRSYTQQRTTVQYDCKCAFQQTSMRVICDNCTREETWYHCN